MTEEKKVVNNTNATPVTNTPKQEAPKEAEKKS